MGTHGAPAAGCEGTAGCCGTSQQQQQQQQQPALFACVVGGGKILTPVRRCGLGGPHPRTSRFWRRFCQRIGHSGISKHAEMAAIAALRPEALQATNGRTPGRRRLTLVVVRLRAGQDSAADGGDSRVELGMARPCDECTKVICALGCFRKVVYSASDGHLASASPEDLLEHCQPTSGKRAELRTAEEVCCRRGRGLDGQGRARSLWRN